MKAKMPGVIAGCLVVAALFLASSCAPAPSPVPKPAPAPSPAPAPMPTPAPAPAKAEVVAAVETPKYGGVFIDCHSTDTQGFDEAFTQPDYMNVIRLTNDELLTGDWAKGPAGTGEASWLYAGFDPLSCFTGALAESWELVDPQTIVFHIRKGVRWHNKPPVNGRELTADDVVFSIKRYFKEPLAYIRINHPEGLESLTAPDKYTVVMKCPKGYTGPLLQDIGDKAAIVPPEVIEKYGNMRDWRVSCGTGPFMLVDYVAQSSLTFVRHPNYWMKDPVGAGKGNQLPYLDGVKWLIVADASTRLAALRTAKVDCLRGILWEEGGNLVKTKPEIKWIKVLGATATLIGMRTDIKPFSDIRVRRALLMAIDKEAIVRDYYGGNAEILAVPVMPIPEYRDAYIPVNKLPESARELYEYHPDKAKQLLAEAGYPNGFKTEVVCIPAQVDMLSVFKDYWAKIGVDLKIDVREYGVWYSIRTAGTHKHMVTNTRGVATPFKMLNYRVGEIQNLSKINDPRNEEAYKLMAENFFSDAKRNQLMREWLPYGLGQAWYVDFPLPYEYTMWWPWVKNYHGEFAVGYGNRYDYPKYIWLDQKLKEKMTGIR